MCRQAGWPHQPWLFSLVGGPRRRWGRGGGGERAFRSREAQSLGGKADAGVKPATMAEAPASGGLGLRSFSPSQQREPPRLDKLQVSERLSLSLYPRTPTQGLPQSLRSHFYNLRSSTVRAPTPTPTSSFSRRRGNQGKVHKPFLCFFLAPLHPTVPSPSSGAAGLTEPPVRDSGSDRPSPAPRGGGSNLAAAGG